jgi:hypothetical protein
MLIKICNGADHIIFKYVVTIKYTIHLKESLKIQIYLENIVQSTKELVLTCNKFTISPTVVSFLAWVDKRILFSRINLRFYFIFKILIK